MSLFLGIDFGTSTNFVTKWDENKRRAIPVLLGDFGDAEDFPNVIYYEANGNKIVGKPAIRKSRQNYDNAVFSIKSYLERKLALPVLGRRIKSEKIAEDIFSWINENVEKKFGGQKISGAVIAVPVDFKNSSAVEHAAQRAGLNVLGLIEEPVAAALSFGMTEKIKVGNSEKILVFDLGDTCKVSIFDFARPLNRQFEINFITNISKKFGGIDIDNILTEKIIERLQMTFPNYNLEIQPAIKQKREIFEIRQCAVDTKKILSAADSADLIFESTLSGNFLLDEKFSRADFEKLPVEFLVDIENVLDEALFDTDLKRQNIDKIIMVGGTCKIPAVQEKLKKYFGKEPETGDNPSLMVGEGAGIYCGLKFVEKNLNCKINL